MKKIYLLILVIIFLVAVLCLKISLTEYFGTHNTVDFRSMIQHLGVDTSNCKNELNEFEEENSDMLSDVDKMLKGEMTDFNMNNITKLQNPALDNLINCITNNNLSII